MPAANAPLVPSPRANGWTAERRKRFFAMLAAGHPVSRACASVGLSREAAYKARRRHADFADGWDRALASARRDAEQAFLDSLPEALRTALLEQPIFG